MSPQKFPTVPLWAAASLVRDSSDPSGRVLSMDGIESWTGQLTGIESGSSAAGTPFHRGDVLFGKLRPYLAKSWLATEAGIAQGDIHVYRSSHCTVPEFLAYVVRSREFVRFANAASVGVKMPRVEWSKLCAFDIPLPDVPTQRRIADYLDRETAQIDAMSGALDGLVARLEERRSASIEIPFSNPAFIRAPLGALIKKMEIGSNAVGDQLPAMEDQKGILKTSAVSTGTFMPAENRVVTANLETLRHHVRGNTLIVNRLNSPTYVGATCVPRMDYENLFLSDKLWELNLTANPKYVSYWTKTSEYRRLVTEGTVGTSSSMLSLSYSRFCRFRIPLPALDLQRRIADHLDAETAKIDAMIAKAGELRALLDERRNALITATVTGQHPVPEEF